MPIYSKAQDGELFLAFDGVPGMTQLRADAGLKRELEDLEIPVAE